ncbi:MAG TPA: (5-formylfuran-3-yl)methyl phosphate synthase [Xanthobacteraceae bacterium]|nr:(5-formylfuran-3-yl)methyl phosphate synthase [Xanthobacteraceae bacterium]
MSLMLASITGPEEAEIAVRQGADIVDLKDVRAGFGTVPREVVRATVAAVARQRPVSAVVGEPAAAPERVAAIASALAEAGAAYIKIGLSPDRQRGDLIRALAPLARNVKLIGVMFADDRADNSLIPVMEESGFAGVMLDTARKTGERLLDHWDITELGLFVDAAHNHGLMAGLAGSLEAPDIPRLLPLGPDVLGFRRALCLDHDRNARIDPAAVAAVRALIPADTLKSHHVGGTVPKVDYRVLAARGYSLEPHKEDAATDRIFVRDFDLAVRVGAYSRERAKPQNVRFNIEARIYRGDRTPEDMRDVFSYDLITDAIRMVAAQEHIALIETLAERIAALILSYARVASVTVRVEKLDIGPGAVGVEIVRERRAEVAKVHQLFPAAGGAPRAAT